MKAPPRSEIFGDVYFSAADGLAETRHVFLKSNNLPAAWSDHERFVIAETGFGTGLNFFASWKLFEETAAPGQILDFLSVEKYPLALSFIKDALLPWQGDIGLYVERLAPFYPPIQPGTYRILLSETTTLTLIFDDVNDALPQLEARVDCWFLDGFRPASNPEMWSETVFGEMGRLSAPNATFATFTAAGFVRRGLENAGFQVSKVSGYGRKREMLAGWKR
ncbi:MAG: tRNA (5-methylaminomethyl-2-thiouridine)(34)-methyltransferase MnmD [Alphaproteobacteria bacterium]|nr:tRNA (5-methylaminomethyl-2-thiouridine)(34)-methyltransferase MnmD [Alphaproteobacteria bacterium]